jgi:FdhD protein
MISIDVADVGWYTLMWTPTDSSREVLGFSASTGMMAATEDPEVLALAAGFMFTEGLIGGIDDIQKMQICASDPSIVQVELKDPASVSVRRKDVLMGSSCGVCGERESIENIVGDFNPVPHTLQLGSEQFDQLMSAMRELQKVFGMTGGAHAAAVFDSRAQILAVAEDLGRHNALDKVIGKCLLTGKELRGCGVLLSSRMSLEMITKAARAGFELIAAVSAPTSLAIEIGERFGITMCGFVRSGRATIYSHPDRIVGIPVDT